MVSGFTVFDFDTRVARWAEAVLACADTLDLAPDRLGQTWHVGVDGLPNEADGSVGGVPLEGPWEVDCTHWHRAQISVTYPGFPGRDEGESDAAHRFRVTRFGAHMDGLLPEGPDKRRHLREPHGFILGLPLNDTKGSPLIVWPGSHVIMRAAFEEVFSGIDPDAWRDLDVTDAYQAARREVFDRCTPEPVVMEPGQAVLLDRHLIHGVAPWEGAGEKRIVAYFRPEVSDVRDWL